MLFSAQHEDGDADRPTPRRSTASMRRGPRARGRRARRAVTTNVPTTPPSQLRTRAIHSSQEGTVSATQRATLSSNETTCPPSTKACARRTKTSRPTRIRRTRLDHQTRAPVDGHRRDRPAGCRACTAAGGATGSGAYAPWQRLNFLPEPHQQGSLRPMSRPSSFTTWCWAEPGRSAPRPARDRRRRRSRRRRRRSRARRRAPAAPRRAASACSASSCCTSTWNSVSDDLFADRCGSAPRT